MPTLRKNDNLEVIGTLRKKIRSKKTWIKTFRNDLKTPNL